jgi:hypothetical protein
MRTAVVIPKSQMKHRILCDKCDNTVWATGEVQSKLIAVCRCPKGHVYVSRLMHDQFDVLYSSAVYAYMGSFYSESILSFTAALERAYEQYVKLYLANQMLDFNVMDGFWKEIANQSERQYGAFCSAYVATEKQVWKSNTKQVSFRNDVIHKGYICGQTEAKTYAEYITEKLNLIMKSIKEKFASQKQSFYFHVQKSAKAAVEEAINENAGAQLLGSSNPSFLKWNHSEHSDVTFAEAIQVASDLLEKYGDSWINYRKQEKS